jgi:hypothetical protein
MSDRKKPSNDKAADESVSDALADPETIAFLKDYLAISDDDLKAHVRRLVEEIRVNRTKKPKA